MITTGSRTRYILAIHHSGSIGGTSASEGIAARWTEIREGRTLRGRKGQFRNSRLKGWFALPILLPGVQLLTGSTPVPRISLRR